MNVINSRDSEVQRYWLTLYSYATIYVYKYILLNWKLNTFFCEIPKHSPCKGVRSGKVICNASSSFCMLPFNSEMAEVELNLTGCLLAHGASCKNWFTFERERQSHCNLSFEVKCFLKWIQNFRACQDQFLFLQETWCVYP